MELETLQFINRLDISFTYTSTLYVGIDVVSPVDFKDVLL